ncbi:hypothetical protein WDU94_004046 [Cyamophila willieti]
MSAIPEDVVARAEIRRRKILENAQRRLDRVLEVSSCQSSDSAPSNPQINGLLGQITLTSTNTVHEPNDTFLGKQASDVVTSSEKSKPQFTSHSLNGNCVQVSNNISSPKSTTSIDQKEFFENISQESLSLFPNGFDFNKTIELLKNQSTPSQDRKENLNKNVVLSHLQYAALAVVVRLMLYFQIGWIFGEMILVPFMLTESIQLSLGHVHTSQLITMLGQVMALCGYSSQLVQTYGKVNSILLHCIEDYSVYFVVFCVIHSFLDEDLESR